MFLQDHILSIAGAALRMWQFAQRENEVDGCTNEQTNLVEAVTLLTATDIQIQAELGAASDSSISG